MADDELNNLQYENTLKLRHSVIIKNYQRQLDSIDQAKLSYSEKETFNRVKNMMTYLANVKIIDAPVLLKIFRLYAQKA